MAGTLLDRLHHPLVGRVRVSSEKQCSGREFAAEIPHRVRVAAGYDRIVTVIELDQVMFL